MLFRIAYIHVNVVHFSSLSVFHELFFISFTCARHRGILVTNAGLSSCLHLHRIKVPIGRAKIFDSLSSPTAAMMHDPWSVESASTVNCSHVCALQTYNINPYSVSLFNKYIFNSAKTFTFYENLTLLWRKNINLTVLATAIMFYKLNEWCT